MNTKKMYQLRFDDLSERGKIWEVFVKDYFQQYIKPTDSVLDIGCGFGEFINNIKAKHKIGLDANTDYKKFVNKAKFVKGLSTKLPFQNNTFDKVFVSNFFEHITRKEIESTIQEVKRVLKKGGEVLVLQPNIRFIPHDYWMFFDHITPVDDRALEEIFCSYGFILKKRVLKFIPYTTKGRLPKHPLLVKLYLKLPFLWSIFGKQSFLIFKKI